MLEFYIRDTVAGNEVHSVTVNLLSGDIVMNDHIDPEAEDMIAFMTGERSTCKTFYDLMADELPLAACMSSKVYSGLTRVRILAAWLGQLAPYYDDWKGKERYLNPERLAELIPCSEIARLAIEYLEKYNAPSFDAIADRQFDDESWAEQHDIGFRVGGAIFAMYDSTSYGGPIPRDEARWTPDHARRYYAWCVASIADYLVRAVGWWTGIGRKKASESREVDEEIQKAFAEIRNLLKSQSEYTRTHAKSPDKLDPGTMVLVDLLFAAAEVTQRYQQEL